MQIQQVILNLIVNGSEAMIANEPRDQALLIETAIIDRNTVGISVFDNGTGIRADLLDQLFEPFVTTKRQGLGLGLTICRSIATAHGGQLWAGNNEAGDRSFVCSCRATTRAEPPGFSIRMKIEWRILPSTWSEGCPLPVVSSTRMISPGPMNRLSPSLAVSFTPASRLTMYWRRGAGCQSRWCSPRVSRKMTPFAGRRLESLLRGALRPLDLDVAEVRFALGVGVEVVDAHRRSSVGHLIPRERRAGQDGSDNRLG